LRCLLNVSFTTKQLPDSAAYTGLQPPPVRRLREASDSHVISGLCTSAITYTLAAQTENHREGTRVLRKVQAESHSDIEKLYLKICENLFHPHSKTNHQSKKVVSLQKN